MWRNIFSGTARRLARGLPLVAALAALCQPTAQAQTPQPWAFGGGDTHNSHSLLSASGMVNSATQINPLTAPSLKLKWSRVTNGAISTTPTVEPGGLYVPDWAGYIYKINPVTGAVIWSNPISNYTGLWGSFSRSSPAIGSSVIVFGDAWAHSKSSTSTPGARVIAVNKTTGALAWQTVVDTTSQWSEILGSPVIYGNLVYVGVASWEESLATSDPTFVPTFRGSVVALNIATGAIVWQVFTAPPGYTGSAVPGTNPAVWWGNSSLMIATGNNYSIPASAGQCVGRAWPNIGAMTGCLAPADYVDSLLSLDLLTGRILWSRRMSGPDTWTNACQSTNPAVSAHCPYGPSSDFDFASMPNISWVPNFVGVADDRGGASNGNIMGAGQKSGVYWGVNPNNGGVYWSTLVGLGNIEWGAALNGDTGSNVYVPINNFLHYTNTLSGVNGKAPQAWNAGAWASLELKTGKIDWQVPAYGKDLADPAFGSAAPGAPAFTNNTLFAGSTSGYFTAINPASGAVLWTYNAGLQVTGGPAIFNETVYWGAGYRTIPAGKPTLFAFSVNGS